MPASTETIIRSTPAQRLERLGVSHRGSMQYLEKALRKHWGLGKNIVLCWRPRPDGIDVLLVPHYFLAQFTSSLQDGEPRDRLDALNGNFVRRLIASKRKMNDLEFESTARRFGIPITKVSLPVPLQPDSPALDVIEDVVGRYSISYVASRAVLLFDIVDFSLLTPFEQTSQLNSLSYSLNSAYSKMLKRDIDIDFARTTTGDGFYIWNRDQSALASVHLFQFMLMTIADNALARQNARAKTVPIIRTGFHVGSHYEFYQAEALNPTMFSYIVGDVTVELARILEAGEPGQIYLGDFAAKVPTSDREGAYLIDVDSVRFVERMRKYLARLKGVELAGEEVESIHCFLTGETGITGGEAIHRYKITDKHGRSRHAYNVRVNIRTRGHKPILLGTHGTDRATDSITGGRIQKLRR
ncbi:MAG: hypothetical protein V7744_06040 [Pseudomonadales bacterium]